MISDELRSEYADVGDVLCKNIDIIKDYYLQCLASSLDEIEPKESHGVFCTIIAICLINDYEKVNFPLNYNPDDEELIAKVSSAVDLILNVEAMADKGIIKKQIVDGETYYSA